MKNLHPILPLLMLWLLISCNRSTELPRPIDEPPVVLILSTLKIHLAPLSETELSLSVYESEKAFQKLRLERQGTVLDSTTFTAEPGHYNAVLSFPFEENRLYDLVLESPVVRDTVYRYRIEDYQHLFLMAFAYEKLADFENMTDFDISPSRQTIFFSDYINNTFVLKKLDLTSGQLSILNDQFENGNLIRALSDKEIMYGSNRWNDRILQRDSLALIRLNVETGDKSLLDFGSEGYGRYSRVVDGHIMVTNPVYTSGSHTIIKLEDGSKTVLPGNEVFPRENFFDQIYLSNQVWNAKQEAFFEPLALEQGTSLMYYKPEAPFTLATAFEYDESYQADTKIQVYKEGTLFFEDTFQKNRIITYPRIIDMSDHKILFFQQFDPRPEIVFNGYYELDLNDQSIRLIQHDNDGFSKWDFQLADQIVSVRADGIYLLKNL